MLATMGNIVICNHKFNIVVPHAKNTHTQKHAKKRDTNSAIHQNQCYSKAKYHKASKLIEARQICFTSLHSFKMAISLPISRAFTVLHSPGSD